MTAYNRTIYEFLKQNGIDINNISNNVNRKLNALSKETILSSYLYSVYEPTITETVSIRNLVGTSAIDSKYRCDTVIPLFNLLEDFFDRDGDTYHNRSVELLDYESKELVQRLQPSFLNDPIYFTAIGEKLYVTINGNHRAFLLLFHELNNRENGKDNAIMIQARVSHLNLELSGMIFLLKQKYGSRFQKKLVDIKNGKMEFFLDGNLESKSIENFKIFVKQEFSIEKLGFIDFRELYMVVLKNSIGDIHFRTAMNFIFDGFEKQDLNVLIQTLHYTIGLEQELRQVSFQNKTFEECLELIKKVLLESKLQALKKGIDAFNRLNRENRELEIVESNIKRTLDDLEREKRQEQFFEFISSMPLTNIELEEEERRIIQSLKQENKKRFSFGKKKRLLNERLNELRKRLNSIYFEYDGIPYTLREFCSFYREAQRRPKQDFYVQQVELEQSLFEIQLQKRRNIHREDCIVKLGFLRKFCDDCEINFYETIQNEGLVPSIEVLTQKRR